MVPFGRKPKKLPTVLSGDEVRQLLSCVRNIKHHTFLLTLYAAGLLEAGVDLLTIGQLLGHKSFSTTMVYLHVRRPHLDSTPSPVDWLPVRQLPGWALPASNRASPHS